MRAIFYNLGSAIITKNCKLLLQHNCPSVIIDGGRDILLENFHGPRSLKCSSVNGSLANPPPEHTYAMVKREFLCDCQLDLEHVSVLRQLSSCSKSSSSKMQMKFTINLWNRLLLLMLCDIMNKLFIINLFTINLAF